MLLKFKFFEWHNAGSEYLELYKVIATASKTECKVLIDNIRKIVL